MGGSATALLFAVAAASLLQAATTLPPSDPLPDDGLGASCTTLHLWSSNSCQATTFCDAGQVCSCPQPSPGDAAEAGLKMCRLGMYCACSQPGEGTCQPLKDKGDACSDSAECRYGECIDPAEGAGKKQCTPRQSLHCGLKGYACGDNFYCANNTSCEERKRVQMECSHSNECRGGLVCMSGQADGGRSCQPLFGRGWDQPCSLTWGECAWGMRCDAGRCAIVSSNQVINCTADGDAACGPYQRCACDARVGQGGGVCTGVVNTECEREFEQLVRCLAASNCPIHDANYSALGDRPSSCVANRCAAEWTVAQCCKVKGHEGLYAFGDETLLGSGCDTSVPASAGFVVMLLILASCTTVSYVARKKYGTPSGGYLRVAEEEVDMEHGDDECHYSVLVGVNEQAFNSERGAELHAPGQTPDRKKKGRPSGRRRAAAPVRDIEEDQGELGEDPGEAGEASRSSGAGAEAEEDKGGGVKTSQGEGADPKGGDGGGGDEPLIDFDAPAPSLHASRLSNFSDL